MIEILKIPFFFILSFLSISGYGLILQKLCLKHYKLDFFLLPILGFVNIFFIVTIIHFFVPLSKFINLILLSIGIIFIIFEINIRYKKIFTKTNNIFFTFGLAIIVVQFIGHNVNEDFGYYHLPYINNFVSDKIIFGLKNLSMVQGYNSGWLNVMSFFYLPFFEFKLIHFANLVLYLASIIFFLSYLKQKKKNFLLNYFIIFYVFFLLTKFSRLNSFGVDVPGFIYASLGLFFFLKLLSESDLKNNIKLDLFFLVVIFVSFASIIKLSYLPLGLFYFIGLYFLYKKNFSKICKISISIFFLALVWCIQQLIYTGCIIFPLEMSCIETLEWYSSIDTKNAKFSLEYINKSFWSYKGDLTVENYISNFNWVATWFKRNIVELIENISTFIFSIFLILFLSKKNIKIQKKSNILNINYALCPVFVGLCFWFLNAPVVRYGIFYINSFIFLTFYVILLKKFEINFDKKFIFILILPVIFNLTKNIKRIYEIEHYNEYPWPKIIEVNYETKKTYNDIYLNKPLPTNVPKSDYCWDIPVYCTTNNLDVIRIKKFGTYKLILKK